MPRPERVPSQPIELPNEDGSTFYVQRDERNPAYLKWLEANGLDIDDDLASAAKRARVAATARDGRRARVIARLDELGLEIGDLRLALGLG